MPDCCSRRSTRVVLPWSTWAMMATLRRFIAVLLARTMAGARSHRKTGTHFSGSRSKPEILEGAEHLKRKPGQKTGHTLLIALQYSQKTSKNNGLLTGWLIDFPSNQRHIG